MNREYLITRAKEIKARGNKLGIRVTIPNQDDTELIVNDNSSIDNKVEYYCKAYDENLVHSMNNQIKIVAIEEISTVVTHYPDEIKIQELYNRGFKSDMFMDIGQAFIKEYKNDYIHYAIIISHTGDVIITNYAEDNSNVIAFNYDMTFVDDLIFILEHLNKIN